MTKVRIAPPRTSTTPLPVPRTVRNHDLTILTSLPAGKMVPIAAIPLLREDSARVKMSLALQMMETAELLVNEVNVSVKAYLVPNLAFERFMGMDDLNRSWEGKPPRDGLPVVPFLEKMASSAHGADPILKYLGKHAREGQGINTAYHEAYNCIWNFRAINRSPGITVRPRLANSLAPAFWHHERFAHIVPDFDQAVMDGEVALNLTGKRAPVSGIAFFGTTQTPNQKNNVRTQQGTGQSLRAYDVMPGSTATTAGTANLAFGATAAGLPEIFAELAGSGVSVSLSNIDLARKTQGFARLRDQYTGHTDDYIIDMLMDGLTVPEESWKQPILLQDRSTIFGMSQRYATNGSDLTKSVVNGATIIDMNFAAPRCAVGGVIMVVAECTPGQLFERGADPYLHAPDVNSFPHALRDMLDPEPVEVVKNEYIDIDHASPNNTFGYAPLNHQWNFNSPQIGGRFYRPKVNAGFDEDRQRIWAVETVNPVLSQDFYICTTMHTKPFVNPNMDPFECTATGRAEITGLTQFGPALYEARSSYSKVMAEAPKDRIGKP